MLQTHRGSGRRRGFTLVEMLVTLGIISVLASLGTAVILRTRARARAIQCLSNQQQISQALVAFYADHVAFPPDGAMSDMAVALAGYIPMRSGACDEALPPVYRCPNDRGQKYDNSYQPYYVRRKDPGQGENFVLGCPRHEDAQQTYLNTLGLNGGRWCAAGRIRVNDVDVSHESAESSRTMRTGQMTFEDGSTATILSGSDDYRITATVSFRQEDGRLYTIVRVDGEGEADFSVTPGSRFEVVTPVAIIGVRGTQFRVGTDTKYTKVFVRSGRVAVWDALDRSSSVLDAGDRCEVGPAPFRLDDLCINCPKHCSAGRHCVRCPLHVNKPLNIGTRQCVECPIHGDAVSETKLRVLCRIVYGRYAYFYVLNPTPSPATLSSIQLAWPTVNKRLDKVALDSKTIYTNHIEESPAIITSGWRAKEADRRFRPYEIKVLTFKFEPRAAFAPSEYELQATAVGEPSPASSLVAKHCRRFCPQHADNVLPLYSDGAVWTANDDVANEAW